MHCSGDYLVCNLGRQRFHFSVMVLCQLLRCSTAAGYFDIFTEPSENAVNSSKRISKLLTSLHLYILLYYLLGRCCSSFFVTKYHVKTNWFMLRFYRLYFNLLYH